MNNLFDAPELTHRSGWETLVRPVRYGRYYIAVARSSPDPGPKGTILLLHGFPTSSWDWHKIWRDLAASYQLIAPDFLGFGLSDKPAKYSYTIRCQADLAEAVLSDFNVTRCHLVAHDYGDSVAQELLARDNVRAQSERKLRSVTLLNGGIIPEAHRPLQIQNLLAGPLGPMLDKLLTRGRFKASMKSIFGPDTKPVDGELNTMWGFVKHHRGHRIAHSLLNYIAERKIERDRWVGALLESHAPLLHINGALDPVSGAHMMEAYRSLGGPGQIIDLPTIGHYPQLEAPDAVLKALADFLTADK